jgi:hypothetical protein
MARTGIIRSTQGITPNGIQFNAYEAFVQDLITNDELKKAVKKYYDNQIKKELFK